MKTWIAIKWDVEPKQKVWDYDILCACGNEAYIPSKAGVIIMARTGERGLVFDRPRTPEDVPSEIQCRKCRRNYSI